MRFLKILSFVSCTLGGVILVTTEARAVLIGPALSKANSNNFGNQAQEIVGGINTPLPVQVEIGGENSAVIPYDPNFATVKSDIVSQVMESGAISNDITPFANEIPEPSTLIGLTAIFSLVTINTLFKKGGKK